MSPTHENENTENEEEYLESITDPDELDKLAELDSLEIIDDEFLEINGMINEGRFSDAEEAVRKSLAADPNSPVAWYYLGRVISEGALYQPSISSEQEAEAYTKAIEAFRRAVELDQNYYDAWMKLVEFLNIFISIPYIRDAVRSETTWEDVEFVIRRAIGSARSKSQEAEGWRRLGLMFQEQRKYADAEQMFIKAIELKQDWAQAWYNLGLVLFDQEKYPLAERAFRKVTKIDSEFSNQFVWDYLAKSLTEQEFYTEAAEAFEEEVKQDRDRWQGWFGLGLMKVYLGRFREGEEALRRAITIKPSLSKTKDEIMTHAHSEKELEWATIIRLIRGIKPEKLAAWRCVHCGAALEKKQVEMLRENPIVCQSCGTTITRDFYLTAI